MPKPNELLIHYHEEGEGFDNELNKDGTAQAKTHATWNAHTHQRYNDDAATPGLVAREFNETAVRFGPLSPGEWELVLWDKASLDKECSELVLYATGGSSVTATRADSAVLPLLPGPQLDIAGGAGGGSAWVVARISIVDGKNFLSLITKANPPTQPGDYRLSLKRLKAR